MNELNGKKYTPATDVGHHFGYSKDYILMLIKQGKIDGQKIGHKWYAHLPSAENYFNTAKQEQEIQRKKLSEERKLELKKFSKVQKVAHHRIAVVETLVIVVIGLSLGVTGYLGTMPQESSAIRGGHSYFENIALALYTTLTPTPAAVTESSRVALNDSSISVHVGTTTNTALIVAPDELFTTTTVESVQDSFSDPVSIAVDPTNPTTGIITPEFKNQEGEAYRFLMVPVQQK